MPKVLSRLITPLLALGSLVLASQTVGALEYRWLERPSGWRYQETKEQTDWFEKQKIKFEQYHAGIKQESVKAVFENYFSDRVSLKKIELKDGRKIELFLEKGANGFVLTLDGEVIFDDTSVSESLKKIQIWGTFTFNNFEVSPDENYLTVPLIQDGSIDECHIAILSLKTHVKFHSLIKDVAYVDSYYWYDPRRIRYTPNVDGSFPEYEFNLLTKKITVIDRKMNGSGNSQEVGKGEFIAHLEYKYDPDQSKSRTILHVKSFHLKAPASIELNLEEGDYPFLNERTNNYLVFSDSGQNSKKLFFIPYKIKDGKDLILDQPKIYKPIQSGSLQRFFSNKDYLVAEYIAGPFKTYHLFNSKAELIHMLNSPKGGSLRSFKHLGGQRFEFEFTSQIQRSVKVVHDFQIQDWNPNQIDESLLTDGEQTKYSNGFYFVKAQDGTSIPLRIVHREGLEISEKTPLFINAYGGHGLISYLSPSFDIGIYHFLQKGGVYAAPGIRGGGEYGEKWHKAAQKTLVRYEDTEAVVKYLHDRKIGSPETTGFEGWSSGGLLAGVMLTRHPELFKLVIPGNGLQDMVRKEVLDFNFYRGWVDEYGDHLSEKEIEFLKSYSPLIHAQVKRNYPTVYVMTGAKDNRVNPTHSYKLVAALQDSQTGRNPILLHRFEYSGHWPNKAPYMGRSGLDGDIKKWQVIFEELGIKDSF